MESPNIQFKYLRDLKAKINLATGHIRTYKKRAQQAR